VLNRCREISIRDAPTALGFCHRVINLILRHRAQGTDAFTRRELQLHCAV
jgi:hypothetical protein